MSHDSLISNAVHSALLELEDREDNNYTEFILQHAHRNMERWEVYFPDRSSRTTTDEASAYEIAKTWLANRTSRQDDPTWNPSRLTLREMGIRIIGYLPIEY